jgi:predicted ferric reductase
LYLKPGNLLLSHCRISIFEQDGNTLKVGTKVVGNFTSSLSRLNTGSLISIHGPYGTFAKSLKNSKDSVWISAGIGLTPFLSMIKKLTPNQSVTMIHSQRSDEPNLITKIFTDYSYYFPNFKFVIHLTDVNGRLDENRLKNYLNLSSVSHVFMCGPAGMRESMCSIFVKNGIKKRRIIFEDFSLK